MKRIVNGVEVDIAPAEAQAIRDVWDANLIIRNQDRIAARRIRRKDRLVRQKVEITIATELAAIDAATTEAEIDAVVLI